MIYAPLETLPDVKLLIHEPLSKYTAARLGGNADAVAVVYHTDALIEVVKWAKTKPHPWIILGGGANVLVSDNGFHGLVIINHTKNVQMDADTGQVEADSGVNLTTLARRCMAQGLQGLEWAVSVPGTLGGAIVNNAGAHGGDMAHNLHSADLIDFTVSDQLQTWHCEQFAYNYRYSLLKGKREQYLILKAILQLDPHHDPKALNDTADGYVAHRKRTQPPGASLGSMFKNPPDDYAGRLIEAAGLKGHRIGGVQISPIHANFFINVGNGTAGDYNALIEVAQSTVLAKFGVHLELEIERIGFNQA